MINRNLQIRGADYKNIFMDIAEKLFTRELINSEEKIKLLNIISRDDTLVKVS